MRRLHIPRHMGGQSSTFDSSALTWASTVTTAGGTVSSGRLTLVGNLIASLKTAGVWEKLDRLWLLAAENATSAAYDLVGLNQITLVNAPTFTIDRGYAGNGTTSYIDTNFDPNNGVNKYLLNDAHYGFYNRTNQAATDAITMNSNNALADGVSEIDLKWSDGNLYCALNDNNFFAGAVAPADVRGIWTVTRTASNLVSIYQAGALFATSAIASINVSDYTFLVCAGRDGAGTVILPTTNQIGAAYMGGGLTAIEAAAFTTALQTYMTAIGA